MASRGERFWETKTLAQMTRDEWESLCDGCGRCCLVQLEGEGGAPARPTRAACRLLDVERCRCTDYENRSQRVPDCLVLSPERAAELPWIPPTCAYKRLARGQGLPEWHPLLTGDPGSVEAAGISMKGQAISETIVHEDDLEGLVFSFEPSD